MLNKILALACLFTTCRLFSQTIDGHDTIRIHNDTVRGKNERQIKEVVINGKKPLIKNNNGVLAVNIEGSPVLSNGTAFETLSKLPGITFNYPNNSFSLKGIVIPFYL